MKTLSKKSGKAMLKANREDTERFSREFKDHLDHLAAKGKKEVPHWDCPICAGRLTIQGWPSSLGKLYCTNCNEYYTVTNIGDLEKITQEVEL